MELERLAEIVDDMIVQHDYPGFEPRALKLGLPEEVLHMHTKTFANALGHSSIYVRLAALRWFQERPGMAKSYIGAIVGLLDHEDEYIRIEASRTLERFQTVTGDTLLRIAKLLKDERPNVRKAAAKSLGKLGSRMKQKDGAIIEALQAASTDADPEVRMKVLKAVRLIES